MEDIVRKELERLVGKKVILFFRYSTFSYNVRKSGKLLEVGKDFFIIDEIQDGRSTFSTEFLVSIKEEDKK